MCGGEFIKRQIVELLVDLAGIWLAIIGENR